MFWILEIFIALVITYVFVSREKPKIKFLFYGYLFFLVSLLLQIPFKYVQVRFSEYFSGESVLPFVLLSIVLIVITEITRFMSLRRFLKTKSYKNGILFGIGWATFESINYVKILFFSFVLSLFKLDFDYSVFLNNSFALVDFGYFFMVHLALTVLAILAIIKKNYYYIAYAVFLNLVGFLVSYYLDGWIVFLVQAVIFIYSFFIVFHYRKLK